jgi:hypothetical protein
VFILRQVEGVSLVDQPFAGERDRIFPRKFAIGLGVLTFVVILVFPCKLSFRAKRIDIEKSITTQEGDRNSNIVIIGQTCISRLVEQDLRPGGVLVGTGVCTFFWCERELTTIRRWELGSAGLPCWIGLWDQRTGKRTAQEAKAQEEDCSGALLYVHLFA